MSLGEEAGACPSPIGGVRGNVSAKASRWTLPSWGTRTTCEHLGQTISVEPSVAIASSGFPQLPQVSRMLNHLEGSPCGPSVDADSESAHSRRLCLQHITTGVGSPDPA